MTSAAIVQMLLPIILGAASGFAAAYVARRGQGEKPQDALRDAILDVLMRRMKPDADLKPAGGLLDANGDGKIDAADALALVRKVLDMKLKEKVG